MEPVPVEPELLSGSEWFQYHPFMGYWHRSTLPEYRKMEPMKKTPQIVAPPSNGRNGATSATSANSFEGSKELKVKKSGVVPFNWNRSWSGTAQEPLVQLSPAFLHTEMGKKTLERLFGVGAFGRLDSLVSYGQVRIYGGAPGGGKSVVEKALRRARTTPQTDDDGLAGLID